MHKNVLETEPLAKWEPCSSVSSPTECARALDILFKWQASNLNIPAALLKLQILNLQRLAPRQLFPSPFVLSTFSMKLSPRALDCSPGLWREVGFHSHEFTSAEETKAISDILRISQCLCFCLPQPSIVTSQLRVELHPNPSLPSPWQVSVEPSWERLWGCCQIWTLWEMIPGEAVWGSEPSM